MPKLKNYYFDILNNRSQQKSCGLKSYSFDFGLQADFPLQICYNSPKSDNIDQNWTNKSNFGFLGSFDHFRAYDNL